MGIIALVASQFSFIKNPTNIVLNAITLFLVALFGWWLVNSVEKEVEAKESLEEKVRERTKELEQSKKVAEERATELEKWYKLTIGRELRMAELKDKIKDLEGN
jgi:C4-dicarboxylate-specific signal transduction histidine kinase